MIALEINLDIRCRQEAEGRLEWRRSYLQRPHNLLLLSYHHGTRHCTDYASLLKTLGEMETSHDDDEFVCSTIAADIPNYTVQFRFVLTGYHSSSQVFYDPLNVLRCR